MDLFAQMAEELKVSKLPAVIYGASVCAERIADWLEKKGIDFYGYAVDGKYFKQGQVFKGKPVYSLEDFLAQNRCDVIVGFMGFSEEQEKSLEENKNVRKLYALDFAGKLAIDEDCQISGKMLEESREVLAKLREELCDEESKLSLDRYIHQNTTGVYRKEYSKNAQYFDEDIMSFSENEIFIDCGAYDGDTVMQFMEALKKSGISGYSKITAFEADPANVRKMEKNLSGLTNIEIVPKGVSDKSEILTFSANGTTSSGVVSGAGTQIEVVPIDEAVNDGDVTFIKMDIEGSELKALMGAQKTIKRCRPKLAVCVYHKADDLMTIPQYIKSLVPDYRLYFRNYREEGTESVIYAIDRLGNCRNAE